MHPTLRVRRERARLPTDPESNAIMQDEPATRDQRSTLRRAHLQQGPLVRLARPRRVLAAVLLVASCGEGSQEDGAAGAGTAGDGATGDGATGDGTAGVGTAGSGTAGDGADADATEDGSSTVGAGGLVQELRSRLEENRVQPLQPPPEISEELYTLGRALAFDKLLSGNRDISCLTCHHPDLGSDDNLHLSLGAGGSGLGQARIGGEVIARNAQSLFNLHLYENMFWDGRVELTPEGAYSTPAGDQLTPEMTAVFDFGVVSAQAMFPVTDASEMRGESGTNELADLAQDDFTGIWAGLMQRIAQYPEYVDMFEQAYPGEDFGDMSFAHAGNAIAAFEIKGFDTRDSPWNRFVAGDDEALPDDALQTGILFFDIGCAKCHSGSTTSDFEFHTLAMAQFGPGKGHGPDGNDDYGREGVTEDPSDRYDFRTPPLFNVELTAPYGHAGQFTRLDKHIQVYTDLEFWRNTYEISNNVSDESLWPTLVENAEATKAAIEEDLRVSEDFSSDTEPQLAKIKALEDFMEVFTDERARDMSELVPASVPSGLPVQD